MKKKSSFRPIKKPKSFLQRLRDDRYRTKVVRSVTEEPEPQHDMREWLKD